MAEVDGYIMLQCFFSLFLCFCFSEMTSWVVVEGTPLLRGGGVGEVEARWVSSPPPPLELELGGGEVECLGETPGQEARLPLRLPCP